MARIAFLLLCHKDPDAVVAQARRLTATGDFVAIHFDARAPRGAFQAIRAALTDDPNVVFARRRHRCGWGEWSLVAATLDAARAALDAFPAATHVYMLSGDCMPVKSAAYAKAQLDADDCDWIESFDFYDSDWIKTGFKAERLIYRHLFNERTQSRRFYAAYELQKRLRLTRQPPADLQVMIGSQWWCLRRRTLEAVIGFADRRPDVVRFFRTTWIPDETFFQTLVPHLVPRAEIRSRTLTFLIFSDYGLPVTWYNDQYDLLLRQDYLFARKVSPEAQDLKARLGELWASGRTDFRISGEGARLFRFLTGRGRVGRRFAPRFWEVETTLGRERELIVVACKKWHVAKRLIGRLREETDLPVADYVFDEESAALPDLGGIEATLEKRARHRRALVRLLFDWHGWDRMVICIDPGRFDLLQDFAADRVRFRVLEIECAFDDADLTGHAQRIGLAGSDVDAATLSRLLPALRQEIAHESERLRELDLDSYGHLAEGASAEAGADALVSALGLGRAAALRIAGAPGLFAG